MTSELQNQQTDSEPAGFGRRLAAAREQLGLSVADIAARLRLQPKQVAAIEAEKITSLPAAYLRGFVRNYAREVRLDPAPLIADLNSRLQPTAASPTMGSAAGWPSKRAEQTLRRVALAAGVGILIVFLVIGLLSNRGKPQQAPSAATEAGAATAMASAPTPAAGMTDSPSAATTAVEPTPEVGTDNQRLLLRFREPSWVEVTAADGRVLLSQLNNAGTERMIEAKPPLKLVIGNASGVEVEFRGKRLDLKPLTSSENVARLTLN
ncbi:MAG: helix-turn-helix domain-containing protein [Sutterellaceae bacterium]|nr:helix-turn-helix domain-containing protein [Burkholderiaceae bacterium]MCX7901554.1 helix-turn-helix domain-containing protein [Burkholderiaceae bacterium]MDW8429060.1 helix-turn-helix domain-containing protein [Sutterellaceae bacterium]